MFFQQEGGHGMQCVVKFPEFSFDSGALAEEIPCVLYVTTGQHDFGGPKIRGPV